MSYNAIIAKIDNTKKHPTANRLLIGEVLGHQIIIGLDSKVGDIGVFFGDDGQLSEEYAKANDLIRYTDEKNGEKKGGFFDKNRRVRVQKFRNEKSEGYFAPLSSLFFTDYDLSKLKVGDKFDKLNNIPICNKYISEGTRNYNCGDSNKKSHNENKFRKYYNSFIRKLFPEHFETEQIRHYINDIEKGSLITITSKLHGSSGRTVNIQVPIKLNIFQKIINKIFFNNREHTKYEVIHGTRRVILRDGKMNNYYKSNFRDKILEKLNPIIPKNYIFYFEIVGYTDTGKPIMNPVDTSKIKDEVLSKSFPNPMIYKYGCLQGECDFYVYRITTINSDGLQEELSWNRVKQICKENRIKHVPEIDSFIYDGNVKALSTFIEYLTEHKDVKDPIDNSHIREGICIRVDSPNGKTKIYKNKLFLFCLLEGIVKDTGIADMEEGEDLKKNEIGEVNNE